MAKKVLKRKRKEAEKENEIQAEENDETLPAKRMSDEPAPKKVRTFSL